MDRTGRENSGEIWLKGEHGIREQELLMTMPSRSMSGGRGRNDKDDGYGVLQLLVFIT